MNTDLSAACFTRQHEACRFKRCSCLCHRPDEMFTEPAGPEPTPMGDRFVAGYTEAERQFETQTGAGYVNPFPPDTDEHRGFEEGVYDFTQK